MRAILSALLTLTASAAAAQTDGSGNYNSTYNRARRDDARASEAQNDRNRLPNSSTRSGGNYTGDYDADMAKWAESWLANIRSKGVSRPLPRYTGPPMDRGLITASLGRPDLSVGELQARAAAQTAFAATRPRVFSMSVLLRKAGFGELESAYFEDIYHQPGWVGPFWSDRVPGWDESPLLRLELANAARQRFAAELASADLPVLLGYLEPVSGLHAFTTTRAMIDQLRARFPDRQAEIEPAIVRNFARFFDTAWRAPRLPSFQTNAAFYQGEMRTMIDAYMAWENRDRARYLAVLDAIPNQAERPCLRANPYGPAVLGTRVIEHDYKMGHTGVSQAQSDEAKRLNRLFTERWRQMGSMDNMQWGKSVKPCH